MAAYKKQKNGDWQAQVARRGIRKAKNFKTKQAAKDWAARQEYLILQGEIGGASISLGELFQRYAREVSSKKRGAKWEIVRLDKICRDKIADIKVKNLKPSDFADWRDRRLLEVAPASVNREMVLMSGALTVARREWGLIATNPMTDVRKPSKPAPRDRRVSDQEVADLLEISSGDLSKAIGRAIHAFQFAIETGMRAGEIVALTWDRVDTERRIVHLDTSKNGMARDVPLSTKAIRLLDALPQTEKPCFDISSESLDVLFRRVRDKAKIVNLRFHDSRHEAITRLARKLDVLDLARMVGHQDIRMLQIYYNATAEDIAKRLD